MVGELRAQRVVLQEWRGAGRQAGRTRRPRIYYTSVFGLGRCELSLYSKSVVSVRARVDRRQPMSEEA